MHKSPRDGAPNLDETAGRFAERFNRLFAYIDGHLGEELTVDVLCEVAGLSRAHFQRQFAGLFGLTIHQYVLLLRVRRASFQLAFRDQRILNVALDAGYTSHEAFTRAFEKAAGQLPSDFRSTPNWDVWQLMQERLQSIRALQPVDLQAHELRLLQFPGALLAAMEHRGDPRELPVTVRRFIAWRRQAGTLPNKPVYNIAYDDPALVDGRDFRFDIGIAVAYLPEGAARHGVIEKRIPAGRCAVLRHVGREDALWRTVAELYSNWLPASGQRLRDYPPFLQRVRLFPDVLEEAAVTDIFLPVE